MRPDTSPRPAPLPGAGPATAPADPRAALLKDRNFRWMIGGSALSMLGDQFTLIALPWLVLQMTGDTLGILIGRRGETLDALQYLTSLRINKGQDHYTRVTLDTENYRAKREDTLIRLANRMANRAVKTGRKVSLEPMNPYERRVIHSALQPNELVDTHSEGEEPKRHIVITLRK